MGWSYADTENRKRAALEAALSEAKRKLGNAVFYRNAAVGINQKCHAMWSEVVADLRLEVAELESKL